MISGPTRIGIIGGGWRASSYLDIAEAFPTNFTFVKALVRSQATADALKNDRGLDATTSFDDFLSGENFDYVVVCTPQALTPEFLIELTKRNVAVLAETPPANTVAGLDQLYSQVPSGARLQVAEQYPFQPQHAARLAVVRSGLLGAVSSAQVSVAHGYHGVSLLRSILELGGDPLSITADSFLDPVVATVGREGWQDQREVRDSRRITARITVPGRQVLGVYEFNDEQYFSPIRSRHLSVFGEQGELIDDTVRYLRGPRDVVTLRLERDQTGTDGDLSGSYLRSISAGDRVLYTNPFAPGRLSDDEIALATVMLKMNDFVAGGPSFYDLAEASHDTYVGLLISEAVDTGQEVLSTPRPWSINASAPAS